MKKKNWLSKLFNIYQNNLILIIDTKLSLAISLTIFEKSELSEKSMNLTSPIVGGSSVNSKPIMSVLNFLSSKIGSRGKTNNFLKSEQVLINI